jgi:hypothetical protein
MGLDRVSGVLLTGPLGRPPTGGLCAARTSWSVSAHRVWVRFKGGFKAYGFSVHQPLVPYISLSNLWKWANLCLGGTAEVRFTPLAGKRPVPLGWGALASTV